MHVRDLDADLLEETLRNAGWDVEEIEMEPGISHGVPLCHTDMMGRPICSATILPEGAVTRRTALLATKDGRTLASCYDRGGHAADRAVAMLGLCLAAGTIELDE